MSSNAIIAIIVLLEIEHEPTHEGFTLSELHREISESFDGSEDDLRQKLDILKEKYPGCFKEGTYWGTPKRK